MSNFKPSLRYTSSESKRDHRNGNSKYPFIENRYKTYKELKRDIKSALENSIDNEVEVIRSRRGEWGEWFERWSIVEGKPKIIKQTWM